MDEARARVVGGAVTGRVVDGRGLPRPGVWVYAHPFHGARFGDAVGVHSDADGSWRLELAAGRWQVREAGADPVDVTVTAAPLTPADDSTAEPVETAPVVPSAADFARRRARRQGA